ncbi:MAG: hypothetical protein M3Q81_04945 [bacterium]|nr:hypothetical protein [bacterium]
MEIYPAILTEAISELQEQLDFVQNNGNFEVLHIDVIDGNFTDAITVTPLDLIDVEFEPLQIDLHIMADEPMDTVFELITAKDILPVRAVIGQVEHMSSQRNFVEEVKKHGWKPGLAIDMYTPVEELEEDVLLEVDVVLLMGVEAGAQGQNFNRLVLEKVVELKKIIVSNGKKIEVLVDGGVTPELLSAIEAAGVDSVAMGSAIWRATSPDDVLSELPQS